MSQCLDYSHPNLKASRFRFSLTASIPLPIHVMALVCYKKKLHGFLPLHFAKKMRIPHEIVFAFCLNSNSSSKLSSQLNGGSGFWGICEQLSRQWQSHHLWYSISCLLFFFPNSMELINQLMNNALPSCTFAYLKCTLTFISLVFVSE